MNHGGNLAYSMAKGNGEDAKSKAKGRFTNREKEVIWMGRLVINGDEVYELDEQCLKEKRQREKRQEKAAAPERKNIRKMNNAPKRPI